MKIMEMKHIRKAKLNCPKVKNIEEQRFKLQHRPFTILVASIISFSSKAPQKARMQKKYED
jgi:hypothetical protein